MTYLFAAIALIIVVVVLSRMLGKGNNTPSAVKEKDSRPADDEYLTDPKTGKRITLEQAMEGYEVGEDEKGKIIPEADPEHDYTEEEIAVMRIQSWMMLEGFGLVTKEELTRLLDQFNTSSIRNSYEAKLEYLMGSEPDPGLFLVITKVAPEFGQGRQGSEEGEHQLLGILRLERSPGDALIEPKHALNPIATAFSPEKEILTDKHRIRLARQEDAAQVQVLDATIEGITNYIAEVQGEYLLIKSNNPATAEDGDDLLNCLLKVKRTLRY